jgi:hypothetical protein
MGQRHNLASVKKSPAAWECHHVTLVPVSVDTREWQSVLETLAQALYEFSHQLQDAGPTGSCEHTRSNSLLHPVEETTPKLSSGLEAGEYGAWNGNEPLKLSA